MAKRKGEQMDLLREMHARKQKNRRRLAKADRISVQVLANGGGGTPASLYISSDHSGMLVNCGEGVQRLCQKLQMKAYRIGSVLVTDSRWQTTGGLSGLMLTSSSNGCTGLKIHSPPALEELYENTRKFVNVRGMNIDFVHCTHEPVMSSGLKVIAIPLFSDRCSSRSVSDCENRPESCPDRLFTYAYLCLTAALPGKLSPEHCLQYGVKPGPLLGRLKAGEDITLPDGRVVKSADVMSHGVPPRSFLIVDVPDASFIPSLNTVLASERIAGEFVDNLQLVVHLTPRHVLDSDGYRSWISEQLSAVPYNMVLNADIGAASGLSTLASTVKVSRELGMLDSSLFPGLIHAEKKEPRQPEEHTQELGEVDEQNKEPGQIQEKQELGQIRKQNREPGQIQEQEQGQIEDKKPIEHDDVVSGGSSSRVLAGNFIYMPPPGFMVFMSTEISCFAGCKESLLTSDLVRVESGTERLEEPLSLYRRQCAEIDSTSQQQDIYPQVVFLGTGSSTPTVKRNTSCILVRTSRDHCMILDCGEGSLLQLRGLYGIEEADRILSQLSLIFVSHLHADHHLGLISLLEGRRSAMGSGFRPVLLAAPRFIVDYLDTYHRLIAPIRDTFEFVDNASLLSCFGTDSGDVSECLRRHLADTGVTRVETCQVKHCDLAYGVRVDVAGVGWPDVRSIVYSGDTQPCPALTRLGKDCDVLIHEATFQDELATDAAISLHSTCSEAIVVGKRMNARYIILTHFSQRYATIARLPENPPDNVGIAFDNMKVSYNQLYRLPLIIPLLNRMYAEDLACIDRYVYRRTKNVTLSSFANV